MINDSKNLKTNIEKFIKAQQAKNPKLIGYNTSHRNIGSKEEVYLIDIAIYPKKLID
jgi:hypothetical protein